MFSPEFFSYLPNFEYKFKARITWFFESKKDCGYRALMKNIRRIDIKYNKSAITKSSNNDGNKK